MNNITLTVALLPTIVIMVIVTKNARAAKEPFKKLAKVFAMSALSVIPAAILELIGEKVLDGVLPAVGIDADGTFAQQALAMLIKFTFIVGIAEECCKYFTFKIMIFNDRDFDNTYDGIIYGACSALGFATLENLMYVFMGQEGGSLQIALLRAVLSIPMHAITGIYMGYYFGITKYRRYNNIPDTHPERKALLFSVVLHGLYDFLASVPGIAEVGEDASAISGAALIVLLGLMVFIYILMGKTIKKAKRETHMIYNRYYYEELGGEYQDMRGGKTTDKGVKDIPMQNTVPNDPYAAASAFAAFPQGGQNVQGVPPAQQSFTGRAVQQTQQGFANRAAMQSGFTPYQQTQSYVPQTPSQPRTVQVSAVSPQPQPEPEQYKYCSSCGTRLKMSERFCHICGVKC